MTQNIDGTNQSGPINTGGTGVNTFTFNVTTTQPNDVVMVFVQGNSGASSSYSISSPGLASVTQRGVDTVASGNRFAEFKGIAASAGTLVITVTINGWGGFGFFSALGFGVSGSDTSTVFDSNGSLPATVSTAAAATGTTSNANDFVYAVYVDGVGTSDTGWTQILDGTGGFSAEYKIVSAAGSQTGSLNPNSVNTVVGVLDALIAATGGATAARRLSTLGVG